LLRVAGLDLSLTAAGVAVLNPDGTTEYGTFGYSLKKKSSEKERIQRLVYVTNKVMGMLMDRKVEQVGIENYGFASKTLAFSAELGGNIRVQLWVGMGIMPLIIPCTSVRKFILGKSTPDKKKVASHLLRSGYPKTSNLDESDALAVAVVADSYFNRRNSVSCLDKINLFERLDRQR